MAPGLRRVVAENPSKFTAWGTGTYIVGEGEVAVIDPGPDLDAHVGAVLDALDGETVTHVLITHTHADHSPASAAIVDATGATTYGYGPHPVTSAFPDDGADGADGADVAGGAATDGATAAEAGDVAEAGEAGDVAETAEEHGDLAFRPDVEVRHGDLLRVGDHELECLHTPGHISNHVCYSWLDRGALFSGDHVMGWSTSVISPPDGRVADYLDSLRLLLGRDESVYYPTHGPPVTSPQRFVRDLIEHRLERERQIVALLDTGPHSAVELVAVMYADVRPELHEPAARSVTAHLVALIESGDVVGPDEHGRYRST